MFLIIPLIVVFIVVIAFMAVNARKKDKGNRPDADA
jgi:Na+/H+ antiporter NhaC